MAREMKDSGIEWIGEIPSTWNTVRFKYLHKGLNTGEAIDKEFWSKEESDLVFYTAGLTPIRTKYLDFPLWKFTQANDILLARNGTPYVYFPTVGACYTDHIIRASMKQNVNRRFVQYALQQSIASVVIDSVSIATWSASLWNAQYLPWPTEEEQNMIVDFLDRKCAEIDSVIADTQRTIEEYNKLKQSVITQAVTKGIRGERPMKDSGIEWIGDIPEEWNTVGLKFLCRMQSGKNITSEMIADEGAYPVYGGNGLRGYYSEYNTEGEYLLVGRQGALCGNVHHVAGQFWATEHAVVTTPTMLADIDFLYYLLIGMNLNQYANNTAAQPGLAVGQIQNVRTCFVPLAEQQEIASYLNKKCAEIDRLIVSKQQLLEELESYKKSVIYEYVTGKKEVPVCQ